jgi:outer membrane protein OmpA-like peptidoglycan-associated protein
MQGNQYIDRPFFRRVPMNRLTYWLSLACVLLGVSAGLRAQEKEASFGVGASFGAAFPKMDIGESKSNPLGRTFIRVYPSPNIGFEAGIGMGLLEAEKDPYFASTVIYPVDLRLLIQPTIMGKIRPYAYGGVGLLFFDPKDKFDQPLLRNSRSEYGHTTSYLPLGVGAEYLVADRAAFGVSVGYNPTFSDNLDDIKVEGKDAFWTIQLNLFAYLKSPNNDLDGDKLSNDEEKRLGTDPRNPDTDGDGCKDGEEVLTYKTNPLNPDTDGDGCKDCDEILTYHTDPLNADTDGDGLGDCEELQTQKTDPLKPDSDGDGLKDGDEIRTYKTNPLNPDTDGDGLKDGEEVLVYKTNPLNPDTDGDGCTDGDEVLKYKTNPLDPDTDHGGMPDCKEIQLGLKPLDPSDDVPIIKIGERIILEGVNFETAKTTLLPSARTILDQVASSLSAYPSAEVAIHGHTDNVGSASYNMKLSLGRAESVKAYLVSKGIPASRISTKGFGFAKPVADNTTPEGRAKNRRIEFVRVK